MATQTIDLNLATADQIVEAGIENIDEQLAMELVQYRDEHGPFETWDDVKDVPGFNERLVEKLQMSAVTLGSMDEGESEFGA